MLYLPRRLQDWYDEKARSLSIEKGEHLFFVLRRYAEERDFVCNHHPASQLLYVKARPSLDIAPLFRCRDCGLLYFKSKSGEWKHKIEAVE